LPYVLGESGGGVMKEMKVVEVNDWMILPLKEETDKKEEK
jgi:hypothetical protein